MKLIPGPSTFCNRPKRSTTYFSLCGTIRTPSTIETMMRSASNSSTTLDPVNWPTNSSTGIAPSPS